jgi:hypothetical protein
MCFSPGPQQDPRKAQISQRIDAHLGAERKKMFDTKKILLLGTGGAGMLEEFSFSQARQIYLSEAVETIVRGCPFHF